MDCPFCDKPDHFFFNGEHLWDCKVCMKSGNLYSFLKFIYNQFDNLVKTSHFISDLRDLPVDPIQRNGIKFNPLNGSYLIPTFKLGKLNNLYKVALIKDKWTILATPTIEHTLFNWNETNEDTIWICEGHWDKIAGDAIVASNGISCIAVPGAGVWKDAWCEVIAEKDIVFCYDNDSSGRQGFEKVIVGHIAKSQYKPKSISYLEWPTDKPKGYDLNDCYKEHRRAAFGKIKEWIKPYTHPEGMVVVKQTIETVEADKSCDSFDKLLTKFKDVYYTTEDMELGLLFVLSSIYSTKIEGEQIWIRLIGPPGSGKTTIAKAVSGSERVVLRSTFTGLFSGWKDDDDEDASLIPIIAGKTLIVKDADALLRQPNIERIFSELRDFYDKDSSTQYRNRVSHDYRNIRSTMVLCGTNVLRRSDSAFLGERFLDYELKVTENEKNQIARKMLERSMQVAANSSTTTPEMPVIAAAKGFIDHHLLDKECTIMLGPRTQSNILLLASIAGQLRTKVDREKFGQRDITFEPAIELPTRLIGQLTKLCVCAPVVLGEATVPEKVHKLLYKVVRDIIDPSSPRLRICKELSKDYLSRDQLVALTDLSISKVTQELDDLRALKLVHERKDIGTGPGRSIRRFTLKEELIEGINLVCHA